MTFFIEILFVSCLDIFCFNVYIMSQERCVELEPFFLCRYIDLVSS